MLRNDDGGSPRSGVRRRLFHPPSVSAGGLPDTDAILG